MDSRDDLAALGGNLDRARYEVLRDHVARLSSYVSLGVEVLADMDEAERDRHQQAVADRLDKRVAERAAALDGPGEEDG